jgi:hypothetical protein
VNDCIDVGADVAGSNDVQFTIATAMPFKLQGSATKSGSQHHFVTYRLVRTSAPSTTIFDSTTGSPANASGALTPGTYEYSVSGSASNDLACAQSGTASDTFNYDLTLRVGALDHYQVELRGWVPMPQSVDPYEPNALPLSQIPAALRRLVPAPCARGNRSTQLLASTLRGENHPSYAGAFRVHVVIGFDWDGSRVSNVSVSTNGVNYGPSHLDFTRSPLANPGAVTASCSAQATATTSTFASATSIGTGFQMQYDTADPLVTAPYALPPINARVVGSFDPQGALNLDFSADLFPSHAVEVTRDGVVQDTAIFNDTSCVDRSAVLGDPGVALLSYALTHQQSGTVVVPANVQGRVEVRSSPLCQTSYDLILVPGVPSAPAPAADAAALSGITVAPASGGPFVPLTQAIASGLVAGANRGGTWAVLVDPAHPVQLKVLGRSVVLGETAVSGGRLKGGAVFGPSSGPVVLSAGKTVTATAGGHAIRARAFDRTAPVTQVSVRRKGKFALLTIRARDTSGVAQTIVLAGGRLVRVARGHARIRKTQLASLRFYSIDVFGNRERTRRLR